MIIHTGKVKAIKDSQLSVEIVQTSACSACHAAKLCRVSETSEKTVLVTVSDSGRFRVGQNVTVCGSESQGMKAVAMAFGLPLVLVILALAVSTVVWDDDRIAALIGLAVLVPYWLILYRFRDRIGKKFSFRVIADV